jgi:predicted ATPase
MILGLKIKNFKSLKDIEIFPKNLNLLTGLNGMGKSSLIQFLLLLRQSNSNGSLNEKGLLLNGDLVSLGTGKDVFYQAAGEKEEVQIELQTEQKYTFYWHFKYAAEGHILPLKTKSGYNQKLAEFNLFTENFQYLNAEHISPLSLHKKSQLDVVEYKQIGKYGEYAAHYLSEFGLKDKIQYENLKHPKAKSDTLIHNVDAWLGEISPGTRIIVEDIISLDQVRLAYQFETKSGYTDEFKPINVGFGLSHILPILVALLSATKGKIILIENPESHIHPRGQSKIGELLFLTALNGIQLFVETHSDHILNGIRVAVNKQNSGAENVGLFFFHRPVNSEEHFASVKSPKMDNNGRIDEWPTDFFDEWENNLLELA